MQDKWFIIVNPRAGSGKTMSEWMPAERLMDKFGIPYTEALTDYQYHAVKLATEAAENGYRKFLAVGGDGTLHEMFRGIMLFCDESGTDPGEFHIGVAPIGSGNDWIKMFNVPKSTEGVVKLIQSDSYGKMDIIRMKHGRGKVSYMANVGGIGFDSHVCERVNWQKSKGKRDSLIYLRALQYTVRHLGLIDVEVIADGQTVYSGELYSIALGNGKFSGGGMKQVPDAVADDGMMDYMIVPKVPLKVIISELPRLLRGTINDSGKVISGKCHNLRLVPMNAESRDIFEVDGEIEGSMPLDIEVTGQQINVIVG